MLKRQKWTNKADEDLERFVLESEPEPKWDIIAYQMEQANHDKNAKQCRERLVKQMDAPVEPGAEQK